MCMFPAHFQLDVDLQHCIYRGAHGHGDCDPSYPSDSVHGGEAWIEYVPDRPFNDQRYHISNSKLITLGWTPRISFTEGLKSLSNS